MNIQNKTTGFHFAKPVITSRGYKQALLFGEVRPANKKKISEEKTNVRASF